MTDQLTKLSKTLRRCLRGRVRLAKKQELSLREANEVLRPFACNQRRKWVFRSDWYSPPTPYGNYYWKFTCGMIRDLLKMPPAFVEGFLHWKKVKKIATFGRDNNPYCERESIEWDHGYILGLAAHYHPERLKSWLDDPINWIRTGSM